MVILKKPLHSVPSTKYDIPMFMLLLLLCSWLRLCSYVCILYTCAYDYVHVCQCLWFCFAYEYAYAHIIRVRIICVCLLHDYAYTYTYTYLVYFLFCLCLRLCLSSCLRLHVCLWLCLYLHLRVYLLRVFSLCLLSWCSCVRFCSNVRILRIIRVPMIVLILSAYTLLTQFMLTFMFLLILICLRFALFNRFLLSGARSGGVSSRDCRQSRTLERLARRPHPGGTRLRVRRERLPEVYRPPHRLHQRPQHPNGPDVPRAPLRESPGRRWDSGRLNSTCFFFHISYTYDRNMMCIVFFLQV